VAAVLDYRLRVELMLSEQQAEAVTRVVREAQNQDLSNLVTKSDLSAALVDVRR
jgi:hypothetical protein